MAEIKGLKENETPSTLFMDEEGNIYMLSSVYNYNEKQVQAIQNIIWQN